MQIVLFSCTPREISKIMFVELIEIWKYRRSLGGGRNQRKFLFLCQNKVNPVIFLRIQSLIEQFLPFFRSMCYNCTKQRMEIGLMNTQQLKDFIIDSLNGKRYVLTAKQPTDINARWGQHRASDGKNYDLCVSYPKNNAQFVTTDECLEDSINFSKNQSHDQNKLNKLVTDIERNLQNGGEYKLELIGNTSFKVTRLP